MNPIGRKRDTKGRRGESTLATALNVSDHQTIGIAHAGVSARCHMGLRNCYAVLIDLRRIGPIKRHTEDVPVAIDDGSTCGGTGLNEIRGIGLGRKRDAP